MGSIGDGQGPLRRPSVSWPGDAEVMCSSTVRHDAARGEMGGFNRRVSSGPSPAFGPAVVHPDDDHAYTDPRLLPIALAIAALITAAVVLWASVA